MDWVSDQEDQKMVLLLSHLDTGVHELPRNPEVFMLDSLLSISQVGFFLS